MLKDNLVILKPSIKKIFVFSFFYFTLATLCFFIEAISNKITDGTYIISVYESSFFYLLGCYYLVQLLPGYAQLKIDSQGLSEIWFFRHRIYISWSDINIKKCKNSKHGDSLYLNIDNNLLFTKKMVSKGCYKLSDMAIFQNAIEYAQSYLNSANLNTTKKSQLKKIEPNNATKYFVLVNMKTKLILALMMIIIIFNGYFLSNETPDASFIEQVQLWQQQGKQQLPSQKLPSGKLDKQLFELFKVYGFYWKTQLKQFDRELFFRILEQESLQIEALMLKRKQAGKSFTKLEKTEFQQQLDNCKKKFLYYDETIYLQCLERI
ncbi:MAG: hypothetical protein QM479_10535 [Pseudomonadota bacterium]